MHVKWAWVIILSVTTMIFGAIASAAAKPKPSPSPATSVAPSPAANPYAKWNLGEPVGPKGQSDETAQLVDLQKAERLPLLVIRGIRSRSCPAPHDVIDKAQRVDQAMVVTASHREAQCAAGRTAEDWKPGRDVAYRIITPDGPTGTALWVHEDEK